ncbi:haloacid dehalogenase-like hydrolase [Actinokineospora enzanensis]|uniref:haloacid dehalogenase-like hydrolase n=1 Tax=Actinokineospora enzanensis TaxID=155975 RepID=UPI00037C5A81|nr:haloacid dehalogenase-like hydrolase [Actinokineospora enzanensis]
MTEPRILVLWDVDQTLVDYRGTGLRWYAQALGTVLGVDMVHVPAFPGRTERSITIEVLEAHGIDWTEEHVERVFAELIAIAAAARPEFAVIGRVLPGVAEVLEQLGGRADVAQSLVTGNLVELAEYKLAAFDLHHHVDLEIGGYGSISTDRHELVAAAVRAAEGKHGTRFAPEAVVVIGDTPHDVAAAVQHGAVGVGVATGRYGVEELRASGAHLVFADLSDPGAVVARLVERAGSASGEVGDQLRSGA